MRRIAALLILGGALTSCTTAVTDAHFELLDGSIVGPQRLLSDTAMFTATNAGELPHTLVVTTNDGTVVAATDVVQPGETVDLAVSLSPGTFQVSCRIVAQGEDGELMDHYELGMRQTVIVSATG